MELINFIGAQASKDGKWLLVTFGRKDTDEKVRLLVPYEAKKGPVARVADDGNTYVYFPMNKKEEPKQEAPDAIAEEELPF